MYLALQIRHYSTYNVTVAGEDVLPGFVLELSGIL